MSQFHRTSVGRSLFVVVVLALVVALVPTAIAATQEELEARAAVVERQIEDLRADIATLAASGADSDDLLHAGRYVDTAERRLEQARRDLAIAAIDRAEHRLDDAEDAIVEAQARLIVSVLNDDSLAAAVNTDDAESVFEFAFAIEMVSDDVVDTGNSALAIASCVECLTLAIATQILFITGDASVISPENLALALNADCLLCVTAAFAYQFVYTTPEDFKLAGEARGAIEQIRREMWFLGKAFERGELDAVALDAALDPLVAELDAILAAEVEAAFAAIAPSPTPTASDTVTPGATPEPDASNTDSASPEPFASLSPASDPGSASSPTPTERAESEPSPTPTDSGEPEPSPTPSPSP